MIRGCGKWRELKDARDRQRVSKLKKVTCWDLGYSCAEEQDADGLEDHVGEGEADQKEDDPPLRRSARLAGASKVNNTEAMCPERESVRGFEKQLNLDEGTFDYLLAAPESSVMVVDNIIIVDAEDLVSEVNVFESVSRSKAYSDEPWYDSGKTYKQVAEVAEQTERDGYDTFNALGWSNSARLDEVRKHSKTTGEKINFGILNVLYGTKNAEDKTRRKFKCRSVCAKEYNAITGQVDDGLLDGEVVALDLPCPEAQKLGLVFGAAKGKRIILIDLRNGYLTSKAKGVKMCMRVPDSWIPAEVLARFGYESLDEYAKDKKERGGAAEIVVPVDGSIYGRIRAGFDFDADADKHFCEAGWEHASDKYGTQDRVYLRETSAASAVSSFGPDHHTRHVDDITAAVDDAEAFIDEVKQAYPEITQDELIPDGPPVVLLGVKIWLKKLEIWRSDAGSYVKLEDGPTEECSIRDTIYVFVLDQRDLAHKAVDEFKDALQEKLGRKLKPKHTPMKPADHWKVAETRNAKLERREFHSTNAAPWGLEDAPGWVQVAQSLRREHWNEGQFVSAIMKRGESEIFDPALDPPAGTTFIFSEIDGIAEEGVFKSDALHYIGQIGYLCEWSRPDLAYARTQLAADAHAWSLESDEKLIWSFGYLLSSVERVQTAYISSYDTKQRKLGIEGSSDASHAQYVTGHGHTARYTRVLGPLTNVPVKFKSKKCTRVGTSSGANELNGMHEVTKDVILADAMVSAYTGYENIPQTLVSDAQAALALIKTPSISKSRYWTMRATHKVDLGWLRDFWRAEGRDAVWKDGKYLAPDLGTKRVTKETLERLLPELQLAEGEEVLESGLRNVGNA